MTAEWSAINGNEDCGELDATITTCVQVEDNINILFNGRDEESNYFEGQISFCITDEKQTVVGQFNFPDDNRAVTGFADRPVENRGERFSGDVTGKLTVRGRNVGFKGVWIDRDADGGCKYEFIVDTKLNMDNG